MDIIKDSIIRVSTRYKNLKPIRRPKPVITRRGDPRVNQLRINEPSKVTSTFKSHSQVITEDINQTTTKDTNVTSKNQPQPVNIPLLARNNDVFKNHERRKFQEFLKPLGTENLKIFNNDINPYDAETSRKNWQDKNSKDNLVIYGDFLKIHKKFESIIDLLAKLTPEEILNKDDNKQLLILESHAKYQESLKFNVPKYHFKPIPSPREFENFQEYIYFITHCKIFNKHTTSNLNGLVNDILLYTHNVDNKEFKHKRNVHTFNQLIEYYGFQKNQNLFTRHLLLIMKLDGVDPNIETFNNLLKMLTINSSIRSIDNNLVFSKILNILKLIESSGLKANLITYERIYSCINNIYLKERFLNKISMINLPITSNFLNLIIDDLLKNCSNYEDFKTFIENDVNLKDWELNDKIFNKVVKFNIINHKQFPTEFNDYTNSYIIDGIIQGNFKDEEKLTLLMKYYQPDLNIIKKIIVFMSKMNISLPEIRSVTMKLTQDFKELSGSNYKIMKKFIPEMHKLELKFKKFNLSDKENQDFSLTSIIFTNKEFKLPLKFEKQLQLSAISIINSSKLQQSSTTIEQRLKLHKLI